MKKIYSALFLFVLAFSVKATNFTVTIIGTPAYSPATLTVPFDPIMVMLLSRFVSHTAVE